MNRRRLLPAGIVLAGLVAVAGCAGSPATSAPAGAPSAAVPSGGAPAGSDNGGFGSSKALEATLPTRVGTVALTTGSINVLQLYTTGNTAVNTLTLFGAGLGVSPAQAAVAGAADPDGKIQIVAAQFTGQTPAAIQAQAETIAKQADAKVVLANTTIGGKPVTTATYPNDHDGPTYWYVTGDTIYILQSGDPALIEDALKQLP